MSVERRDETSVGIVHLEMRDAWRCKEAECRQTCWDVYRSYVRLVSGFVCTTPPLANLVSVAALHLTSLKIDLGSIGRLKEDKLALQPEFTVVK